jgi:hypothetical protein
MYAAYLSMAIGYFIVCYSLSRLARKLERKIGVFDFESYRPDTCRDEYMLLPAHKRKGQVCVPPDTAPSK